MTNSPAKERPISRSLIRLFETSLQAIAPPLNWENRPQAKSTLRFTNSFYASYLIKFPFVSFWRNYLSCLVLGPYSSIR